MSSASKRNPIHQRLEEWAALTVEERRKIREQGLRARQERALDLPQSPDYRRAWEHQFGKGTYPVFIKKDGKTVLTVGYTAGKERG